jgi:hypothetical protein
LSFFEEVLFFFWSATKSDEGDDVDSPRGVEADRGPNASIPSSAIVSGSILRLFLREPNFNGVLRTKLEIEVVLEMIFDTTLDMCDLGVGVLGAARVGEEAEGTILVLIDGNDDPFPVTKIFLRFLLGMVVPCSSMEAYGDSSVWFGLVWPTQTVQFKKLGNQPCGHEKRYGDRKRLRMDLREKVRTLSSGALLEGAVGVSSNSCLPLFFLDESLRLCVIVSST